MRRTIIKIKEWFFKTMRHGENDVVPDLEFNIPEVSMPIANDVKNIDASVEGEYVGETDAEDLNNKLMANCEVEDCNNVKFNNIEPVSLLEIKHQKEAVKTVQGKVESTSEKVVNEAKLVSLIVDSIKYYDKLRSQMPTDDLKNLLDDVSRNLIDNLIMSGCTPINEESGSFDMSRHRVEPFQMIDDGTPYSKLTRKGVVFQNEVKLLAIVEL